MPLVIEFLNIYFGILIVKKEITYQTENIKTMYFHCTKMILTFSISVNVQVGLQYSCEQFNSTWNFFFNFFELVL